MMHHSCPFATFMYWIGWWQWKLISWVIYWWCSIIALHAVRFLWNWSHISCLVFGIYCSTLSNIIWWIRCNILWHDLCLSARSIVFAANDLWFSAQSIVFAAMRRNYTLIHSIVMNRRSCFWSSLKSKLQQEPLVIWFFR